jgi:hypothetical protein
MSDIGHFEFGNNVKPIDFQNWVSENNIYYPFKLEYWLNYWIITYEYLLNTASDESIFCSFESLCNNPFHSMKYIAMVLEINDKNLLTHAKRIAMPKSYDIDLTTLPTDLVKKANNLYTLLERTSII